MSIRSHTDFFFGFFNDPGLSAITVLEDICPGPSPSICWRFLPTEVIASALLYFQIFVQNSFALLFWLMRRFFSSGDGCWREGSQILPLRQHPLIWSGMNLELCLCSMLGLVSFRCELWVIAEITPSVVIILTHWITHSIWPQVMCFICHQSALFAC